MMHWLNVKAAAVICTALAVTTVSDPHPDTVCLADPRLKPLEVASLTLQPRIYYHALANNCTLDIVIT